MSVSWARRCVLESGFLQKVYRGSLGMMVNAMVEDQALSEEEIQELYDILGQAKAHKDKEF